MMMDTMGNTWGTSEGANYEATLDSDGSCRAGVGIYLVGQGHDHPERDVFVILDVGEDHVPDEQVEVEDGHEADGQAYGQPPFWEELQRGVLQLAGRRQRASVQDGQAQLGRHGRHRLFGLAVVSTQVNLEREQSRIRSLLWLRYRFYFYISAFAETTMKGRYRLQRFERKMN